MRIEENRREHIAASAKAIDIDEEIKRLERRRIKLKKLLQLSQEVSSLEWSAFTGTETRCTIGVICEEVCKHYHLGIDVLMSANRQEAVCVPRQIVFYIARQLKNIPYKQIGVIFQKDHGTAMHGCQHIKDRVQTDQEFAGVVEQISKACAERIK